LSISINSFKFLQQPSESYQAVQLKDRASKVVYGLSIASFNTVFSRIAQKYTKFPIDLNPAHFCVFKRLKSISNESSTEFLPYSTYESTDIELIQHIHVDVNGIIKLLRGTWSCCDLLRIQVSFSEICYHKPFKKDSNLSLVNTLEKVRSICNKVSTIQFNFVISGDMELDGFVSRTVSGVAANKQRRIERWSLDDV